MYKRQELEATYWESLDQMLSRMDFVSVNCPHTPATYHLLSARRLALLKPSAYLINTARGEVLDEAALARMLEKGQLAGAGLDAVSYTHLDVYKRQFETSSSESPESLIACSIAI